MDKLKSTQSEGQIMEDNRFLCPACKSNKLMLKYEANYVYSYAIDKDAPGMKNTTELLPFLYDSREQTESKQYILCSDCGTQYPCFFLEGSQRLDYKVLQHALEQSKVENDVQNKNN